MPSPNIARVFLNQYQPPRSSDTEATVVPVAVFVGGTAGIGASIASEITQGLKGDVDVFVVGRNAAAGQAVLDSLPSSTHNAPRIRQFVRCDATLMRDVIRAADDIKAKTERINFLVMSQGMLSLQGRTESTEGIDAKLALHYYSRWKFTHELLPLIKKAKDDGQDAKVMTILAAGHGGKINTDDVGLKDTYSVTNAGLQGPSYNDCMIQSFAKHHPTISFIHAYPGLVRTSLASSSNSLALRLFSPVMTGLTYAIGTSAADCGARLAYGMLRSPAGWSRLNDKGEDIGDKSCFADEDTNTQLWRHTAQITAVMS